MSRKICSLGISFFVALSPLVQAAEFLVKWKSEFHPANVKVLERHDSSHLTKIDVPAGRSDLLASLESNPAVEYVVPNSVIHSFTVQGETRGSDPQLLDQWALKKINASSAWSDLAQKGSRGVTVAILDTGVDFKHDSLKTNLLPGYDFQAKDSDPTDETGFSNAGHGTHCAGIVGATGKINGGVSGVSPVVSILPVRILDKKAYGTLDDAIQAIDYAIAQKAAIISASWGGEMSAADARPLTEAVQRANEAGILFVTSAGNGDANGVGYSNDEHEIYPANINFTNTISVAASDEQDRAPRFSNFGKMNVDLAAPGTNIMSTLPVNQYYELSGTSMSAPLVAGLAALLKAQDSTLSAAELKALLQISGEKVDIESGCNCRIDAAQAVSYLVRKKSFVVPYSARLDVGAAQAFELKNGTAISFTSSDPSVANVSTAGIVRALAPGRTQIEVRDANGDAFTSAWIYVR